MGVTQMTDGFSFVDHMEELSQIADRLFEALRLVNRLDEDVNYTREWLGSPYSEQNWREIPNIIRHAILSLVYASYLHVQDLPPELIQWRQDIYAELDELATKPRHLRRVK